jgi:hypothetical protein
MGGTGTPCGRGPPPVVVAADVQGRGRWAVSEAKGLGGAVPSRPPHDQRRDERGQDPGGNLDPPQHDAGSARARPRRNPRDRSIRALAREPNTSARTVARAEAVMAGTTKPNSPLPAGSATINAEHAATSDAAAPRSILPAPSPPSLRSTLAPIAQPDDDIPSGRLVPTLSRSQRGSSWRPCRLSCRKSGLQGWPP